MKISLLFVSLVLVGCCKPDIIREEVPVWTPPVIDVPSRPVTATYNEADSEGVVVRKAENDMLNIKNYAEKLENLIDAIKKGKPGEIINIQ